MKRMILSPGALLALTLSTVPAAHAASANELKLPWKMTAQAAPVASTTSALSSSGLFAWPPFSVWSTWMQLSTSAPGTVLFVK